MPITDGWLNVFRLSAADPIQEPDADLRATHELFGGAGPESWLSTTVDDALEVMDATGVERALLTVSLGGVRPGEVSPARRRGVRHRGVPSGARALPARPPVAGRVVAPRAAGSCASTAASTRWRRSACSPAISAATSPIGGCIRCTARASSADCRCDINVGIAGPMVPSKHQHPELLEDLLIDFPDLTVIGCHMGHPWEDLMIRLIMKFPNLYLMTSGYLPKYFAPALVKFMGSSRGAGRILFGSDHPGIPLPRALEEARKLPLSDAALDQFLGTALCDVLAWK